MGSYDHSRDEKYCINFSYLSSPLSHQSEWIIMPGEPRREWIENGNDVRHQDEKLLLRPKLFRFKAHRKRMDVNTTLILDLLSGEPKKIITKADMVASLSKRLRFEELQLHRRLRLEEIYRQGNAKWEEVAPLVGEDWVTPYCYSCEEWVDSCYRVDENVEICEKCLRQALEYFTEP